MTHIVHNALPQRRGYYSKVEQSRTIVQTGGITMWDQVIPAGGYITPHLHDCKAIYPDGPPDPVDWGEG